MAVSRLEVLMATRIMTVIVGVCLGATAKCFGLLAMV